MDILGSWGGGVRITITEAITAPGGQKLALNDTGDGVLVWYKDHGVQKLMAVGLAASRSLIVWLNEVFDYVWDISSLPNLSFSGQVTTNMTDAEIDALPGSDSNTAKLNTDMIVQAVGKDSIVAAAAISCRERRVAGRACSLPNMNQLRRIYALRHAIDSLDPTASGKPMYKLSNWGFGDNGGGLRCWSSDERDVSSAWSIDSSGLADSYEKLALFGVIPILELDPTTLQPI